MADQLTPTRGKVDRGGVAVGYRVVGTGPPLVALHPFLFDTEIWNASPAVAGLADWRTVVMVDHLAHGTSDGPLDRERYTLEASAANVAAVMDELGIASAGLWGYSLGAWVATGMALHYPHRVRTLVLGGWDVVNGGLTQLKARNEGRFMPLEGFLASVRPTAPDLVAWITADREPAMAVCWQTLFDEMPPAGTAEVVKAMDGGVLMWNGEGDAYHPPMQRWAAAAGIEYFTVPGDHGGAPFISAEAVLTRTLQFLRSAEVRGDM